MVDCLELPSLAKELRRQIHLSDPPFSAALDPARRKKEQTAP